MPRVKRGPKRKNRRAKILKAAKGFWGMKSRGHRIAKQQVERGLNMAYAGRKDRKGEFRAIAGGGRYDNLVKLLSGGRVDLPALGFGMGDVVLLELLIERVVVRRVANVDRAD